MTFLFFFEQEACCWGDDISDSQLDVNTRTADLMDKIELLKDSVKDMSVGFPSETYLKWFLSFWDCTGSVGSLEVMCSRANSQQIAD